MVTVMVLIMSTFDAWYYCLEARAVVTPATAYLILCIP